MNNNSINRPDHGHCHQASLFLRDSLSPSLSKSSRFIHLLLHPSIHHPPPRPFFLPFFVVKHTARQGKQSQLHHTSYLHTSYHLSTLNPALPTQHISIDEIRSASNKECQSSRLNLFSPFAIAALHSMPLLVDATPLIRLCTMSSCVVYRS